MEQRVRQDCRGIWLRKAREGKARVDRAVRAACSSARPRVLSWASLRKLEATMFRLRRPGGPVGRRTEPRATLPTGLPAQSMKRYYVSTQLAG